jgi:N-acetylneuraminate synthase
MNKQHSPCATLGSRHIRPGSRPYVIAEIGVNHGGDLNLAKRLIALAKEGGADAAKFQTYKAERIASRHSPAYWDRSKEPTESQFALFKKYDRFGPDEFFALAEYCRDVGIDFVSTPFDLAAVDFLDPLVPFHKVASADLNNVPLLRQIAGKGKPVVMSTGASTLAEIETAVQILVSAACKSVVLLHCILNYPCPNRNAHLNMIEGLRRVYPSHVIGYSDHTLPDKRMLILTAAWLRGALVLEKHFTHDKTLPGNDHYHAMDVDDLKVFIANIDLLEDVLGQTHKEALPEESSARKHARRSIVIERPLKIGHVISEADITCKRPADGISPSFWDQVIGRRVIRDLDEDHVLQWQDLS